MSRIFSAPAAAGFCRALSVLLAAAGDVSLAASASGQFSLAGYLIAGVPASFDLAGLQSFADAHPASVKTVSAANAYLGVSSADGHLYY
jgi:hypothetical protein